MAATVSTIPVGALGELPEAIVGAGGSGGRPAYVYDLSILRRRCQEVAAIPIERKRVFFATMANDHPSLIECVGRSGHGIFVNSPRHLELALASGFDPDRILYAASNMVDGEMRACAGHGVRLVLDSVEQLRRFGRIAGRGREVGLRVSIGVADGARVRFDPGYRFGVLPEELDQVARVSREVGVRVTGIHSYFGTDLPVAPLVEGVGRLAELAVRFPEIGFVDAGGGFCVSGPGEPGFDLQAYGRGVARHLAQLEARIRRSVEFVVEPGRYLAAGCGYFFVTVVDVKEREDRVFVGTDGSVAIFPRPLMYPDRAAHPCGIVGREADDEVDHRPVYICGNSTYSQDFLARAIRLPLPKVGDTLVFGNAGAYCRSMVTRFLGKERPAEIVLDGVESSTSREELDLLAEAG